MVYEQFEWKTGQHGNGFESKCPGYWRFSRIAKLLRANSVCCLPFQGLEWRPMDVSKFLVRRKK